MPVHTPGPPPLLAARDGRRRHLIGLTPLIDVVFILLVFFMLASSFLDWRSLRLDPPATADAGGGLSGSMLVDIRPDSFRLSGEILSLDAIARRLGGIVRNRPDQAVIVRPAEDVSLQRTVMVLDRLSAAGVSRLSLNRAGGR
ncbi:ExbD/TolR family protein [Minwuia sp.]|uniref:ExbD/TolR family protein n=1 Tax=Minwuia sp. TaxID=2493630 RepID=UPI003A8EC3D3